jgi:hypothetical protein
VEISASGDSDAESSGSTCGSTAASQEPSEPATPQRTDLSLQVPNFNFSFLAKTLEVHATMLQATMLQTAVCIAADGYSSGLCRMQRPPSGRQPSSPGASSQRASASSARLPALTPQQQQQQRRRCRARTRSCGRF